MHRTPSVLTWLSQRPHIGHFPSLIRLPIAGPRRLEESPSASLNNCGRKLAPSRIRAMPARPLTALGYGGAGPAARLGPRRGGPPRPPAPPWAGSGVGAAHRFLERPPTPHPPPAFPRPSPWRRAGPARRGAAAIFPCRPPAAVHLSPALGSN